MDIDWSDVEVFYSVAKYGSLSAAARELNKSQPTIGRRIQQLENQLSLTLFTRTPYGYQLTGNGSALYHDAEQINRKMNLFKGKASILHENATGIVKIACGESFAQLLLENMDALTAVHPALSIQIHTGIRFVNLEKGDADLAIRSLQPTSPNLYARFLGHCQYAVYASSEQANCHSLPISEHDIKNSRWISYYDDKCNLPVSRWLKQRVPAEQIKLQCNTLQAVLQGVKNGQGLAALPVFIGERTQGLTQLSPALPDLDQKTWLVSNRNAKRVKTTKVVSNWIDEIFEMLDDACFISSSRQTSLTGYRHSSSTPIPTAQ